MPPDSGDLVAAAVAELYASDPDAFTTRRTELAGQARAAGDRAAAQAIAALRRPTRAAWVLHQLSRADPSAARRLAELGAALQAAQEARDGRRLRELSAARGPLLDLLADTAFATAGLADPPPGLRAEVSATLAAALADPVVADQFAAGTLTKAADWAGFGALPAHADAGHPATPAVEGGGGREAAGGRRLRLVPDSPSRRPQERDVRGARTRSRALGAGAPSTAATRRERRAETARPGRAGQEDSWLGEQSAERAARQRHAVEESERMVAAASAATAEAAAAEERLEDEVRDLEERLTRSRADLSAARMRARRAEAAERRARAAHDRLPRP